MTKHVISSIFHACIGVFYLVLCQEYNAGSLTNPQPGFFPRIVGYCILLSSLVLLLSSLRRRDQRDRLCVVWEGLTAKNIRAALMVLGSVMIYLFVLTYVGFLIASAALVSFLAWVMGGRNWIVNLALGLGSSGFIYWLFWIVMRVPIPLGSLWGR